MSEDFHWKRTGSIQKKEAQYGLGLLYWQGKGVEQDFKKAEHWLRKAADNGNEEAALKLGFLHLNGLSGQKDKSQARKWFLKAADAGQVDAQHNLGILFLQGIGGPKDPQQAIYWFTQAARQGDMAAKRQLEALNVSSIAIENSPRLPTLSADTHTDIHPITPQAHNSIKTLSNDGGNYAIQIAVMANQDNVQKMIRAYPSPSWRLFKKNVHTTPVHVLLHCCFADRQAAKAGILKLPPALQKSKPIVVDTQRLEMSAFE